MVAPRHRRTTNYLNCGKNLTDGGGAICQIFTTGRVRKKEIRQKTSRHPRESGDLFGGAERRIPQNIDFSAAWIPACERVNEMQRINPSPLVGEVR